MKNRGRGVPLQSRWFSDPVPDAHGIVRRLERLGCEGPPSGNISNVSLVYQRKYLPGKNQQASPPRRPGQGRRNFAMNVPASRLTEKMTLTLAASLLAATVLPAPAPAAQAPP